MSTTFSFLGSSVARRKNGHSKLDPSGEELKTTTMTTTELLNRARSRIWFFFDERGKLQERELDKYTLATRLHIPLRDMRVLDPMFAMPYPSSIFIRDQSILLNLEHLKVIICADQAWVLDTARSEQFNCASMASSLARLKRALRVTLRVKEVDPNFASAFTSFHDLSETVYQRWAEALGGEEGGELSLRDDEQSEEEIRSQLLAVDLKLPYELRAVEAALNEFTRFLDEEVASLEDETALALHDLTHKVSRESLDTVKSTKSTVNGLFSRVSKVREELERLLDDDEDMFSMYLQDREDMPNVGNSAHLQSPIPGHSVESIDINSPTYDYANAFTRRRSKKRMNKSKLASHASAVPFYEVWAEKEVDVMESVEAFLEVYFLKSDFLLKRLLTLKQKIDDTEDLVNIDLDFRRNELFKVDILLTSGTLATGLVAAVAGIFGMNMNNNVEEDNNQNSYLYFVLVAVLASCGCVVIFCSLYFYLKARKLMF